MAEKEIRDHSQEAIYYECNIMNFYMKKEEDTEDMLN